MEKPQQQKTSWDNLAWAVLVSMGIYWLIGFTFLWMFPEPPTRVATRLFALGPQLFLPEVRERQLFLGGVLFFPVSIFAILKMYLRSRASPFGAPYFIVILGLSIIFLLVLSLFGGPAASAASGWIVGKLVLGDSPWLYLIFGGLGLGGLFFKGRARRQWLLSNKVRGKEKSDFWCTDFWILCSLLLVIALSFLSFDEIYVYHNHFNAVFYSVVQVVNGKVILKEFSNQYGLYPLFLSPLFKLFDLTIESFSLVMGVLSAFSLGCVYYGMKPWIRTRRILVLAFLAMLFFSYLLPRIVHFSGQGEVMFDRYFQFVPIRVLFPCITFFLFSRFLLKPNWVLALLVGLVAVFGVFWNLESGVLNVFCILAAGVWFGFVRENQRKRFWRSLWGPLGLGLLLGVGICFKSFGDLPLSNLLYAHRVFVGSGYNNLPMPFPHPWMLGVANSLFALGWVFSNSLSGRSSARDVNIIFLLILWLGFFTYYQGRSHDYVFVSSAWPSFLILIFMVDVHLKDAKEEEVTFKIGNVFVTGFLGILAISFFSQGISLTFGKRSEELKRQNSAIHEIGLNRAGFIKSFSPLVDRPVFLSESAALNYLRIQKKFVCYDSFHEMFLVEDYKRFVKCLNDQRVNFVFLEKEFAMASIGNPFYRSLLKVVTREFKPFASSRNGTTVLLKRERNL